VIPHVDNRAGSGQRGPEFRAHAALVNRPTPRHGNPTSQSGDMIEQVKLLLALFAVTLTAFASEWSAVAALEPGSGVKGLRKKRRLQGAPLYQRFTSDLGRTCGMTGDHIVAALCRVLRPQDHIFVVCSVFYTLAVPNLTRDL
jgi:hypothetical protein